ncbi:MAG: hypothetical protein AAFX04_02875 [Pseudomonadota bacterium]
MNTSMTSLRDGDAADNAAADAASSATYAGWAFKAVSVGISIYGAIQSARRHAELMDTLKNYHEEEMAALGQIMNQILFGQKQGLMETYVNNINNVFKDLTGLDFSAEDTTSQQKIEKWLTSVQMDGSRCALDNLRNFHDKISFDPDAPDGSLLALYCDTLSNDHKTQSQGYAAQLFWNDALNIVKRGQCNLVARYMMEIDRNNQGDIPDDEWRAKTDKPEITQDQIEAMINDEWDGELADGYTNKFDQMFDTLRDNGFAFIAESDSVDRDFDSSAAREPDRSGSDVLSWKESCETTDYRDPENQSNGSYKTYSYSTYALEGKAVADNGCAVIGLEFVKADATYTLLGVDRPVKSVSLRLHFAAIDNVLSGALLSDSDIKTVTIGDDGSENFEKPTKCFKLSHGNTHHVNTGHIDVANGVVQDGVDTDCGPSERFVIVGAGLRKAKKIPGYDRSFARIELRLWMQKYDLETGTLNGDIFTVDSANVKYHDYLSGADDEGEFETDDEMKEKFSLVASQPSTVSLLGGAAIRRRGGVSYFSLKPEYLPDIPEQSDAGGDGE